eukprot:m.1152475 g.1152475  ORF g.1152475 m.1152475 type:complete len:252 (+) comp24484_c0_seq5:171-926(+)
MPPSTEPLPQMAGSGTNRHTTNDPESSTFSTLFPQSMRDWYSWSWVRVCLRIGGPKTAQRIQDSMLTIGLAAAIFLTFQVDSMLNPPSVDPEEYETALKFYGCFWVIATFFTAASMMLSVTIVVQLVTIKYDSKSVSTALARNNAQHVISFWTYFFFYIGAAAMCAGLFTALWMQYARKVFWIILGIASVIFAGLMYFQSNMDRAMQYSWKAYATYEENDSPGENSDSTVTTDAAIGETSLGDRTITWMET